MRVCYTSIKLTLKIRKKNVKAPLPQMASPSVFSSSVVGSTCQPGPQPWHLNCSLSLSFPQHQITRRRKVKQIVTLLKLLNPLYLCIPTFLCCLCHYPPLPGWGSSDAGIAPPTTAEWISKSTLPHGILCFELFSIPWYFIQDYHHPLFPLWPLLVCSHLPSPSHRDPVYSNLTVLLQFA